MKELAYRIEHSQKWRGAFASYDRRLKYALADRNRREESRLMNLRRALLNALIRDYEAGEDIFMTNTQKEALNQATGARVDRDTNRVHGDIRKAVAAPKTKADRASSSLSFTLGDLFPRGLFDS